MRGISCGVMPSGLDTISSRAPNASIVRQLLLGERVGRDDVQRISLDRADERERAARAAARVLDNGLPRLQSTITFGALDHRERHSVLVGARGVRRFELHPHLGQAWVDEPSQSYERSVPDSRQHSVHLFDAMA